MVDRAYAAWTNGHITGMLLLDITAAFPKVAKEMLVNLKKVWQIDGHLIQCMESIQSERMMDIVMKGNAMDRHSLEAEVPQGSPESPTLFAIYVSELIN
jgi:hypothetical protein